MRKKTMVLTLLALLALPHAGAAELQEDECARETEAARAVVAAHKEEWTVGEALAYAWARLAEPCRLRAALAPGEAAAEPSTAPASSTTIVSEERRCELVPCEVEAPLDATVSEEIVGNCTIAGTGIGTIRGSVLGIELFRETSAVGEWGGVGGAVKVDGEGVLLGGSQTGKHGTILVAGVLPIPTLGENSDALCVRTVTRTPIEGSQRCEVGVGEWHIYFECSRKVTFAVTTTLLACSATANQTLAALAAVRHAYEVDGNPCRNVSVQKEANPPARYDLL